MKCKTNKQKQSCLSLWCLLYSTICDQLLNISWLKGTKYLRLGNCKQIHDYIPVEELTYSNLRLYKSFPSHNYELIWPIDSAALVQYPVVWGVQIEKRKWLGGWHTHVACHFNEIYYGWHAIKFTQVVAEKNWMAHVSCANEEYLIIRTTTALKTCDISLMSFLFSMKHLINVPSLYSFIWLTTLITRFSFLFTEKKIEFLRHAFHNCYLCIRWKEC